MSVQVHPHRRLPVIPVRLVAAILILALLVSGVVVYRARYTNRSVSTALSTAAVSRGSITSGVTATGPVTAAAAVPLNFKTSGKLAAINVKVGDQVAVGQVLAELDTSDLQASLQQAQAGLASAQAAYDKLKQGLPPAELNAAAATVSVAQTQLAAAQHSLATAQVTSARDVASAQQAVEDSSRNLQAMQAQVEAGTAADRAAVANAERALADAQRVAQGLPAVLAQTIEQAKERLYADQVSYDYAVARGTMSKEARQAALNADQVAIDQANASAQQQLAQSQQTVNQARTALDSANNALNSDLAKFEGSLVSARTQANTAAANLASAQARAAQTVQSAQDQVAAAQSALAQAQANYDKAAAPAAQADLDAAQAQVSNAQASVKLAQNNLDAARLAAPASGTVTAINGAVGQWITGGAVSGAAASAASGATTTSPPTTMISLTSLSGLQVTAQVNEADISKVKMGQAVTFTVDAFAGHTFSGRVAAIQPLGTTTNNVVTYSVLIDTEPGDVQLLPGMTASAKIVTSQADDALRIPISAVTYARTRGGMQAGQGQTIYVLQDGEASARLVQLGINDGKFYEVLSGLSEGEKVIVAGGQSGASSQQGGPGRPGGGMGLF